MDRLAPPYSRPRGPRRSIVDAIRILTALTYYDPHWTGLTVYAKRIAEGLAARGHDVTVVTTRHLPELPERETIEGVDVVRLRPVGRFSRGMVVPSFPLVARRLVETHDIVHVHTPMPEAPILAGLARLRRRPLVMTHQGDLVMPSGLVNQAVQTAGTALLHVAARLATAVCPLSGDYAKHSAFLRPYRRKMVAIHPPAEIPTPRRAASRAWRRELGLEHKRLVGFAGRFVEEKGFDYLLAALPLLRANDLSVQLVFAGERQIVYENFYERCRPLIDRHRDSITFLGLIRDARRLADFYAMCDVFALPSRTDMFAAVQLEAMLCGTPVVAADIPGAREPVRRTGMGVLVPPRDPAALAEGIARVLADPLAYTRPREEIAARFDARASVDAYGQLMCRLVETGRGARTP